MNYRPTMTVFENGRTPRTGPVHPEVAEPGRRALLRDLRAFRRHRCGQFLRLPYDRAEVDAIHALAAAQGKTLPGEVAAIVATRISRDTSVRVAVTAEQAEHWVADGVLDLRRRATGRGFR